VYNSHTTKKGGKIMQTEQYATMWAQMKSQLDEKQRRLFAGSMAQTIGRGGLETVHKITGLAINTIKAGKREHETGTVVEKGRARRMGGGRKRVELKYENLPQKVKNIVDDSTYGNPEIPLSYTTKSLRKIADELKESTNIEVNHATVSRILDELEYSKQTNQKMLQVGEPHPDRNEQFEYINTVAKLFINYGEPVISVDTKKKENIGNFKNNGQEYLRKGEPRKSLDHDFQIKELGKLSPYGVYCQNNNTAFVNAGTDHDTSEFAVESISRWWEIFICYSILILH
jgi:transposase